jgi:TM2 domain-containing membrane protein YozV
MGRPAPGGYQQKSKIVAGLLGIFLGAYGVHNFYLGFTGKAVTQLLLSIIGYITVWFFIGIIPLMIASIWGLVEGIMILCTANGVDAHGVPLAD